MNPSCPNIKFRERVIQWIAQGIVGKCIYRIKSFADAIFLGSPVAAIDEIASALGPEGEGIDGKTALEQITPGLEKKLPQLTALKNSGNVALTGITLFQEESITEVSIGLEIKENNQVGNIKVDGIGLSVRVQQNT